MKAVNEETQSGFGVFQKFLCFPLPNVNKQYTYAIGKHSSKNAIKKRTKKVCKLELNLEKKCDKIKGILSSLDWTILNKELKQNIKKTTDKGLATPQPYKTKSLSFSHKETVTNLSMHKLTGDELHMLNNGLNSSIKPARLNSWDIISTFEWKTNSKTPTP